MTFKIKTFALAVLGSTLFSTNCQALQSQLPERITQTATASTNTDSQPIKIDDSANERQQAEQQARLLFAEFTQWELSTSPMLQAYRGLKTNYDQWDDLSESAADRHQQKIVSLRERAKSIDTKFLNHELKLSLELLTYELDQSIFSYPFRHYNYPINNLFGLHTEIPSFLVNIHQIKSVQDAKDYISRVEKIDILIEQLIEQLEIREAKGIIPPKFVFEAVMPAIDGMLQGYPLEESENKHILWESFVDKLTELQLYASSQSVLERRLKKALNSDFRPAYESLKKYLQTLSSSASPSTGFHQFEEGNLYYQLRLKQITTLNHSPDDIHQTGLELVNHIHTKIQTLLPKLIPDSFEEESKPTIFDLFELTRNNQDFYYTGAKQAIRESKEYIMRLNKQLGSVFKDIPELPLQVKPVEAFRAKNAPVAFYQPPSDDGSRPGTYYMNLEKLSEIPKFQYEALAYHETIPGHHLQTIYALETKELPNFRRHAHFTAYSEGWALYAEALAKELNGYSDPWNEYGYLLMSLWRATRLVIDTGLHAKKWTLEEALEYRLANTPFTEKDSIQAIQRYLVMPGQATSYMMGFLEFVAMKEQATKQIGDAFDLGDYHSYMLRLGPLPLPILSQEVDRYIKTKR